MKVAKKLGTLPLSFMLVTGCTHAPEKEVHKDTVHMDIENQQNGKESEKDLTFTQGDTLMDVMKENYDIQTGYGGKFIKGINGTVAEKDSEWAWMYTINGKEATVGPADYKLKDNDKVEFDYKKWK